MGFLAARFFGSVYLSISSRSLSIPAHVGRGDRNAPAPAAATLVKQEQQQQGITKWDDEIAHGTRPTTANDLDKKKRGRIGGKYKTQRLSSAVCVCVRAPRLAFSPCIGTGHFLYQLKWLLPVYIRRPSLWKFFPLLVCLCYSFYFSFDMCCSRVSVADSSWRISCKRPWPDLGVNDVRSFRTKWFPFFKREKIPSPLLDFKCN